MEILIFVSSHCSYCPRGEKVVRDVVSNYSDYNISLRRVRVRTDEGKKLAEEFCVMSVPTILLVDDNGKEIERIVGVPSEDSLKDKIEKQLKLKKSIFDKILGK